MSFDWIKFFEQHKIPYVTKGPNVSRGRIAIHCPWCGIDDPSEHLSIRLDGPGFTCWRNKDKHWGKRPEKLIQALLKCSWDEAHRLAGNEKEVPSDFMASLKAKLVKERQEKEKQILRLPKEFKPIGDMPSAAPYKTYLSDRGFTTEDIEEAWEYGIFYASQGLYKGRIIFTVRDQGQLVGWTGRTIYPTETLRYKTLTHDPEKARERGEIPAPAPISDYLLFIDYLRGTDADTVVLCEGPVDAWNTNILGKPLGVVATCFFTSTLSNQQINLLHAVLPKFKYRYLLLDQNTFAKSARMKADLAAFDVEVKHLPPTIDDPGEIPSTKMLEQVLAI